MEQVMSKVYGVLKSYCSYERNDTDARLLFLGDVNRFFTREGTATNTFAIDPNIQVDLIIEEGVENKIKSAIDTEIAKLFTVEGKEVEKTCLVFDEPLTEGIRIKLKFGVGLILR